LGTNVANEACGAPGVADWEAVNSGRSADAADGGL
jgi:hypothetical protein